MDVFHGTSRGKFIELTWEISSPLRVSRYIATISALTMKICVCHIKMMERPPTKTWGTHTHMYIYIYIKKTYRPWDLRLSHFQTKPWGFWVYQARLGRWEETQTSMQQKNNRERNHETEKKTLGLWWKIIVTRIDCTKQLSSIKHGLLEHAPFPVDLTWFDHMVSSKTSILQRISQSTFDSRRVSSWPNWEAPPQFNTAFTPSGNLIWKIMFFFWWIYSSIVYHICICIYI